MNIGICSGYFQRFHEGHRTYIQNAQEHCERVIVIINNDAQQRAKYKAFENIRTCAQIAEEIRAAFPTVETIEAIDPDETVCRTLGLIYSRWQPGDTYLFCKDADRNAENIPETKTLEALGIGLLQFHNKKENSSSELMRRESLIRFEIYGETPSKKNSKIYTKGRHIPIPSKAHQKWHNDAMLQMNSQKVTRGPQEPIDAPVAVTLTFYHGDQVRRDSDNQAASIMDLLQDAGVLADDRWQIVRILNIYNHYDKGNARCVVELKEL